MKNKSYQISALNIVTHPHTPEKYLSLFQRAFEETTQVPIIGDKWGHIASLRKIRINNEEDFAIHGLILKYTQINKDEWYNITKAELATKEELGEINIPANLRPNTQQFQYVFFPQQHRFIYISKHSEPLGDRRWVQFSPGLMKKFLTNLFSQFLPDNNDFEITIEQSSEEIEKIIKAYTVSKLEILINLPNDDAGSSIYKDITERLNDENVSIYYEHKTAKKDHSIVPSEETIEHINVAKSNGYVRAEVINQDGKKESFSTEDHPKSKIVSYEPEKGMAYSFINKAKIFLSEILN